MADDDHFAVRKMFTNVIQENSTAPQKINESLPALTYNGGIQVPVTLNPLNLGTRFGRFVSILLPHARLAHAVQTPKGNLDSKRVGFHVKREIWIALTDHLSQWSGSILGAGERADYNHKRCDMAKYEWNFGKPTSKPIDSVAFEQGLQILEFLKGGSLGLPVAIFRELIFRTIHPALEDFDFMRNGNGLSMPLYVDIGVYLHWPKMRGSLQAPPFWGPYDTESKFVRHAVLGRWAKAPHESGELPSEGREERRSYPQRSLDSRVRG